MIVHMYRYVEELEGNEASTSGWDVLFYGDSIIEEWRCCTSPFACTVLPKTNHILLFGCMASPADIMISLIEKFMVAC